MIELSRSYGPTTTGEVMSEIKAAKETAAMLQDVWVDHSRLCLREGRKPPMIHPENIMPLLPEGSYRVYDWHIDRHDERLEMGENLGDCEFMQERKICTTSFLVRHPFWGLEGVFYTPTYGGVFVHAEYRDVNFRSKHYGLAYKADSPGWVLSEISRVARRASI